MLDGVVMLVNEFTPVSGGAEKQAERLAGYMAIRGRRVWVITRRFPGLAAEENLNGVTVIRPVTLGPGKLKTVTFVLGILWNLWRLRNHYKILHAHMLFGPAFAAVLAGKILKKSVIVKLGSSGPTGEIAVSRRTLRGRLRLSFLRRWADVIIALDDVMLEEAVSVGFLRDRVHRMSNGIDVGAFSPAVSLNDAKLALGVNEKIVVLFIGRFVPEKSLPTLLYAFQYALKVLPDLSLVLVGQGPEGEFLKKLTHELNLQHQVTFAGDQLDVKRYLHAADMFVLPSKNEGMSNALMEGMAAGLACIATLVGANSMLLDYGECGILVPPGDSLALGQALIELGQDSPRRVRLGNAAQKRMKAEFDFSVIGARYESVYQDLIMKASAKQIDTVNE